MGMNPRLLRPLATGFDPRRFSGLELWLDFSDTSPSNMTTSGTPVTISQINDKSGKGWVAQGTVNNRPTLTTNAINGRSVASFNGTSAVLTIASFPAITDATAFAVCYRNWTVNAYRVVASSGSYAAPAGHAFFLTTGLTANNWVLGDLVSVGNGFFTSQSPSAIGPNSGLSDNQAVVLSTTLNTASSGMWRNGTSIATRVATAGTGNSASGTFRIGASSFGDWWNGAIAEFILYGAALSAGQIKTVERYLGAKYAITIA